MGLSTELISEFVKITNDNKKGKDENTVYGTVKTVSEDKKSGTVQIDGSDVLTPFTTTCTVKGKTNEYEGDRVRLTVRDHNAIVTGNTTDISASAAKLLEALAKITKFEEDTGLTIQSLVTFKSNLEKGEGDTVIDGGCIDTTNLNLSGCITFDDFTDEDKETIEGAIDSANAAVEVANGASKDVSDITVLITQSGKTKTFIDGSKIAADSVYANSIHLGGALTVYTEEDGNDTGGYLGYDNGFNSKYGIGIRDSSEVNQVVCTDAAARLSSGDARYDDKFSQFVASGDYAYIEASTAIVFDIDDTSYVAIGKHSGYGSLRPHADAPTMNLGNGDHRWGALYATNGTIQTSDRNYKNNIEALPDKYVVLFDNLVPRRFKMNEGTSGRYHIGYIAQEVEDAMLKAEVDCLEFGGFVRDIDADGKEICMLRYGEFDAIYAAKIKQLESRINELERRLANLETKEVG